LCMAAVNGQYVGLSYLVVGWSGHNITERMKATVGRSSSNRESVEREIKAQLRDIMTTEDLENITSKQ
ncbi:hypothetical protein M9458_028261, partial [Cirrhinus mrigala]